MIISDGSSQRNRVPQGAEGRRETWTGQAGLSKSREREGSSFRLHLKKLFILIGDELLYSIVVVSAIH